MTTIYVDSRKRVAGTDADFEFDVGETVHLQNSARLGVFKIRVADTFLSADRGTYLYWRDAALNTLNWAQLPVGAYTGARLSNFAAATYVESTNEITVAWDGNRTILNDQELRNLFPSGASYPAGRHADQTLEHQPPARPQLHRGRVPDFQLCRHEPLQRAVPSLLQPGQRRRQRGTPGTRHHCQDHLQPGGGLHHAVQHGRQSPSQSQGPDHLAIPPLQIDRFGRQCSESPGHQHQFLHLLGRVKQLLDPGK